MATRKRFIVDKKFQYNLIFKNLVLLVITFAFIAAALLVWERHQLKQGFLIRLPQNPEVVAWARANNVSTGSAEFVKQFLKMAKVYTFFELLWKPLLAALAFNVIIMIGANVYYSNKIAGPISRLKEVLRKRLDGGSIEPVYFRKNDAFKELAELVNKVLEIDGVKAAAEVNATEPAGEALPEAIPDTLTKEI